MTSPAHDPSPDTITPVEPVVAAASEPERFERAGEISDRLVDNIETVVYGKRDEIKLVLTALMCDGHVLLEDVPGTAKTVLARAIAGSIEGATPAAHPVHARPPADRRHRALGLRPADARLRVPAGADLRERRPRRRDQPRDPEDAVRAARGDGRAAGDRRRRHARAAVAVPPPRDREPDRVRGHVPAPRGAARPLLPAHRARVSGASRTSCGSSRSSASRIRSASSARWSASTRCTSCARRRSTCTSTSVLHRWVVELVRATREQESVVIGSSVRGQPRARARRARMGAPRRPQLRRPRGHRAAVRLRCSSTASCSRPGSSRAPARRAGRRRSRSSARAASSSRRAPARRRIRSSRAARSADRRRRSAVGAGRSADLPARSPAAGHRALVRDDEEPAARLGHDVAGSRPYRPGDDMDSIDWAASARLSTARGSDEFIVRERFAEEAPKVVIVCDRRPQMACFASAAAVARQAAGDAAPSSSWSSRARAPPAASSATSTTRTATRTGGSRRASGS